MKKLTTKLLISVLSIALAIVALGTQTYAWFAMNRTVTATGMQVSVKSDSVFLVIGNENNLANVQSAASVTTALTVSTDESKVYPVAHDTIADTSAATATNVSNPLQYQLKSNPSTVISIDEYNGLSSEDQALYQVENRAGTNWFYQIANNVNASTSTKQKNYLATLDATYVIHKTCYITLASGSNDASNLKVSASFASNGTFSDNPDTDEVDETFAPVKVLVTSSTTSVELSPASNSSDTALAATVTDSALVQIDIFIYYDGTDTNVFTNNVVNLDGAAITLSFNVD